MDKTLKTVYRNCKKRMKSACWKVMEKAAGITYTTAKAFYKFSLHYSSKHFSGPPLLIYTMGKVGSETVTLTLRNHVIKINMPIYHTHHLTHDFLDSREKKWKKYFHQRKTRYFNFSPLWQNMYLRKRLDKQNNGRKWKIVTLVRDPIAVNISKFFHHMQVEFIESERTYKIKSFYFDFETAVKIEDTGILLKLFLEKADHQSPLFFFDDELKRAFGFDVYSLDFAKSRGYQIYNDKLVDVLLIKLENLNSCMQSAFKEFLNIEVIELSNTNLGIKKAYAPIYKTFKDSVVIPDAYMDKMYDSRYMRHFYTDDEINSFKAIWGSAR